jgi:hypothetical protein
MSKRSKTNFSDPLELLSMFESGVLSVQLNGYPFVKIDAVSHQLDLEAQGIKEFGLKLGELIKLEDSGEKGIKGIISTSRSTARKLSERGWSLAIYDKGSSVLKMGRGVSRLTGHISVNILRLRGLLKNL